MLSCHRSSVSAPPLPFAVRLQDNPSVGLEVCPYIPGTTGTKKRDETGGVVLLEEIARCLATVPDGKGFEVRRFSRWRVLAQPCTAFSFPRVRPTLFRFLRRACVPV